MTANPYPVPVMNQGGEVVGWGMDLERAIAIAAEAHMGQTDKAGAPYILHPLRVMMACETEDERIVAVMHDVLEDCEGWHDLRLLEEGFLDIHVDALRALCRGDDEDYASFIRRAGGDPIARRVKIADLRDNMDLSRLPTVTDRDRARQAKYAAALAALQGPTHD